MPTKSFLYGCPSILTAPEARARASQPLERLLQVEVTPEQWGLDQALAGQAGKLDEVAGGLENSHTVGTGAKEADFDLYRGDPSRTLNGSGRISSPDEWNKIISDIERAGGKVRLVEEDSIGYTPRVGESAGEITISKDASISALRHEAQHFYNDMEANWPGWRSLLDPEARIANELKAYTKEIDLAKKWAKMI